jgi:hypothetical protein
MILISLVGEQPAPNLLPARRLKPDIAVLVHTERTQSIAANLRVLLEPRCACRLCDVDPYHIPQIYDQLSRFIADEFPNEPVTFNLTGGTKPMVLAAYRLAQERGSLFVYFRTEGNRSCLYRYTFSDGEVSTEAMEELPETISLDDYLRLYLSTYDRGAPRNAFEQQVFDVLEATPGIAEVFSSVRPQDLGALEVDFAIRCGNQVGIGEVKTKGAKSGIDQINAVADPRYLGTYVRKFLVSAHPVDQNNRSLAQAYSIDVIELSSYGTAGTLDLADREKLGQTVVRRLSGGGRN